MCGAAAPLSGGSDQPWRRYDRPAARFDRATSRAAGRAAVKLEAYPFTRYGTLSGQVIQVSPDAIVDEKRGLVLPVRVKPSQAHLRVDCQRALLSAGMSASVEIVTGKRRVIDFVWPPVAKTVSEAGRQR
jgi:hemolysin D